MANPNNILNQNLAIGGDLAVIGNSVVTGNVVATGRVASGTAIGVVTPTLGSFVLDFTEVLVTLDTTGDTTAINFGTSGLPAGALAVSTSIRVVSTITGINSTTGTLNLNPTTGPSPAGIISAFTAGSTEAGIAASGISIDGADADTGEFVLSGGGDNTPTGGSIRVTVYFWRVSAPTS
jgi:hypothetical protein